MKNKTKLKLPSIYSFLLPVLHFTLNNSIFFPNVPALSPPLHGLQFTSGCMHLLQYGVLHGLQVGICSITFFMGCWGTIYATMVFSMGCRRLCFFYLDHLLSCLCWPWCLKGWFLSHLHPQHSHSCCSFLPFLEYIIAGAPFVMLAGSSLASSQSVLETYGRSCVWQGDSSGFLVTKPPCYQNLAM